MLDSGAYLGICQGGGGLKEFFPEGSASIGAQTNLETINLLYPPVLSTLLARLKMIY